MTKHTVLLTAGVAVLALMLTACGRGVGDNGRSTNEICSDLADAAGACNDKCCCASGNDNIIEYEDYRIDSGNNGTACVDNSTGKFQIGEGARITYKGTVIEGPAEGNLHEIE